MTGARRRAMVATMVLMETSSQRHSLGTLDGGLRLDIKQATKQHRNATTTVTCLRQKLRKSRECLRVMNLTKRWTEHSQKITRIWRAMLKRSSENTKRLSVTEEPKRRKASPVANQLKTSHRLLQPHALGHQPRQKYPTTTSRTGRIGVGVRFASKPDRVRTDTPGAEIGKRPPTTQ